MISTIYSDTIKPSVIYVFQKINVLDSTFHRCAFIIDLLGVKQYNTSDFCWSWLSTKFHWTKVISTTSRLLILEAKIDFLMLIAMKRVEFTAQVTITVPATKSSLKCNQGNVTLNYNRNSVLVLIVLCM